MIEQCPATGYIDTDEPINKALIEVMKPHISALIYEDEEIDWGYKLYFKNRLLAKSPCQWGSAKSVYATIQDLVDPSQVEVRAMYEGSPENLV